jgi:broad specificity phosphatase PhoE
MGTILLVRHGQASFGAADYDYLSETGLRQSSLLGAALRARVPSVTAAWCGTMRRHRQTADACLLAMGATTAVEIDHGWDEYDHEGIVAAFAPRYRDRAVLAADLAQTNDPLRAFQQIFAQAVARWVGGVAPADYRESWDDFRARVAASLAAVAKQLGKAETALVFTSGGPISVVCGGLLQVPEERQLQLGWTLANASVSKLLCRGDVVHLSTLNEHSHFEGEHRALITYR